MGGKIGEKYEKVEECKQNGNGKCKQKRKKDRR
jgi:hypothetical protein